MSYGATCTDCEWSFEHENRERVTEALERHARKEFHTVNFERLERLRQTA